MAYSSSSRFSPLLSFRSLIVLHFTCRSDLLELIFVKSIRSFSWVFFVFVFCMWMSSDSSTICCKDHLCSIVLLCSFCQRSTDYIYKSLFMGSLFCFIDLLHLSILSPMPHCLITVTLLSLMSDEVSPPT